MSKTGVWLALCSCWSLFQRNTRAQSHTSLCNLFSCVSFLPLSIVKYKARIQILTQLVCGQVFGALLCLSLGLLPSSSDLPVTRGVPPACAVSEVKEGLDRQWWLSNLCQMPVSQTDYTNTAAFR